MGYQRKKRYHLVFDDEEFDGLEVTTKPVPLGVYLRMKALILAEITEEVIEELFGEFAKILDSWNYEDDDGHPVPATYEGLRSLDIEFAKAIVRAWNAAMTAVAEVDDAPLPEASDDGAESVEASIPMVSPSESQAS